MKTQKNWQKVSSVVLGLMAAGFMVVLAGCPSPLESSGTTGGDSPVMAAGQGVVRVSLGEVNAARTLMPVEGTPAFTRYELTFTNATATQVPPPVLVVDPVAGGVINSNGSAGAPIEVALEAGDDWEVELTAYTTPSGYTEYYRAAYGTASFDLDAGEMADVTINITPITDTNVPSVPNGNGNGIFRYTIQYPASGVYGTMTLTGPSPAITGISLTHNDLSDGNSPAIDSKELAPGTYDLKVSLWKGAESDTDQDHQPFAGTYTAVHIYSGLETVATGEAFTFTDADFVDAVYLAGNVALIFPPVSAAFPSGSTTLQVTAVKVKAYKADGTPIDGGEVTIPYPVVTPGSPRTATIPWFLSIPLSATSGGFYLEVTVTDGNGHSYTGIFSQPGGQLLEVLREGDDDIHIPNLVLNLAGVRVNFDGMPEDKAITLDSSEEILFWQDNTTLDISVGGTVTAWHLDGVVISGVTGSPLSKTATDFSPGNHTITAKVSIDGKTYSKTVSFITVEDKVRFDNVTDFATWISAKPINDPATPYAVKLLDIDLSTEYGALLTAIGGKYVALDLSGAGGTTLPGISDTAPNKAMIVSVILPDLLTSIGENAFRGCTALTTINLPDRVTSIGANAFNGCIKLATIDLPTSLTSIGANAFNGCTSLAAINALPTSLTGIGNTAFQGCTSLATIALPGSLTTIGIAAFNGCTSLATINLLDLVTTIDIATFQGCTSLATIDLPTSLASIGENAFRGCTALVAIGLPTSLTIIGANAFNGCTKLAAIDWSATSPSSIGTYAFNGCTSLVAIGLPTTLDNIGTYAFNGCTALIAINLPDSLTSISANVFYNCTSLIAIRLPTTLTSIGESAFQGCTSLATIALPTSLSTIDTFAFKNCAALVIIDLPASLTGIGISTFTGCTKLATVTLKGTTPPTLDATVFDSSVTRIYVPSVAAYTNADAIAKGWDDYAARILLKS